MRLREGPLPPQECATGHGCFGRARRLPQTWVEPRGRPPRPKGVGFLFCMREVIEMTESETDIAVAHFVFNHLITCFGLRVASREQKEIEHV